MVQDRARYDDMMAECPDCCYYLKLTFTLPLCLFHESE